MNAAAGRLARGILRSYFTVMVVFLYLPLLVLVISLPDGVLVILPRLHTVDRSIGEAARDLGAGALAAFYRVTMPLILPAIVSSFVIAFTISFDEVAIANFLVPPGHNTFPTYLYNNARTPYLRPQTVAIGGLIIAASLMLIVLSEAGRRRSERKLGT